MKGEVEGEEGYQVVNDENEERNIEEEIHQHSEEHPFSPEVQEQIDPWVRPMNPRACFLFE